MRPGQKKKKTQKAGKPSSSFCCSLSCLAWGFLLAALIYTVLYEFNVRGKWLWLTPVPTADLSIDLEGKVAIVTGANTGIGLEITKGMAAMGADVILACRNLKKGANAIKKIEEDVKKLAEEYNHKPGSLEVIRLDLSSFASIRSFVDSVQKRAPGRKGAVDILVNNAALISDNTQSTDEGFRNIMGVNYFGPFLLTHLLLPDLLLSAQNNKGDGLARVVNVASMSHSHGIINFEDIDHSSLDGNWNWHFIYGTSKTGNVLFTETLAQKLNGSGLIVNSNHPGVIRTEISRSFQGLVYDIGNAVFYPICMSPWQGAQNTIYGASSPLVVDGAFYNRFDVMEPSWAFENVDEVRDKLWKVSCELVGVKDFESWKELV